MQSCTNFDGRDQGLGLRVDRSGDPKILQNCWPTVFLVSLCYQESEHRARGNVPRQSLRALVQLHVVQQYVEGVTVRVCGECGTASQVLSFAPERVNGGQQAIHMSENRCRTPLLQESEIS